MKLPEVVKVVVEKVTKEGDDSDSDSDSSSDDEETKKAMAALKAKNKKKKVKKAKIDKSMVGFDVKVYDENEDFDALFDDILDIEKDGLTWNKNFELVEIAFGM